LIGELAVSFCENKAEDTGMCIDIWSYPDGTCNVVVSARVGSVVNEFVFPSAPYQLIQVIEGNPFFASQSGYSIQIEHCNGLVCAQCDAPEHDLSIQKCVSLDSFRIAMAHLQAGAVGYLA